MEYSSYILYVIHTTDAITESGSSYIQYIDTTTNTNIDISDNKNIIFANYKLNTSARYTDTDFNFRYLFLRDNYSSNKVSSIQFVSMASISSDGVWILKEQSESIPIRVFYSPAV